MPYTEALTPEQQLAKKINACEDDKALYETITDIINHERAAETSTQLFTLVKLGYFPQLYNTNPDNRLFLSKYLLSLFVYKFCYAVPAEYARVIPANKWSSQNKHSGVRFENSMKSIILLKPTTVKENQISNLTISMSDFRHLNEAFFFAALILISCREGYQVLINSIVLKPLTNTLVDNVLYCLGYNPKKITLMSEKIYKILKVCRDNLDAKNFVLAFLITSTIDPVIAFIFASYVGATQNVISFIKACLTGYNHPIPKEQGGVHEYLLTLLTTLHTNSQQKYSDDIHEAAISTQIVGIKNAEEGVVAAKTPSIFYCLCLAPKLYKTLDPNYNYTQSKFLLPFSVAKERFEQAANKRSPQPVRKPVKDSPEPDPGF